MRRIVLTLLAALLLAVPAAAQYTPVFWGDQLTIGRTEVGSVLIAIENIPWSSPPLENNLGMHGYIESTPQELFLQFDVMYLISHDAARFLCAAPHEWRVGKYFGWMPEMGCYVIWYQDPADPLILDFQAVSVHISAGLAYLYEGRMRFTGHPPYYWDLDPGAWLLQWQIEPFQYVVVNAPAPPEVE